MTSFKNERTYGTNAEAYTQGDANQKKISSDLAVAWHNRDVKTASGYSTLPPEMTSQERDTVHKQWMASQKSAVSQLGFDPGKILKTDKARLNVGGFYDPNVDETWVDTEFTSAAVHESMHRGVEMMRKEGLLPKMDYKEEYVVRALMLRHFGEIERQGDKAGRKGDTQVDIGKRIPAEVLDKIEKAAEDYLAKKRPGGPR